VFTGFYSTKKKPSKRSRVLPPGARV